MAINRRIRCSEPQDQTSHRPARVGSWGAAFCCLGFSAQFMGCRDPVDVFAENENVTLATDQPARICGGTPRAIDAFIDHLASLFPETPGPIEIEFLSPAVFPSESPCGENQNGCTFETTVYTKFLPAYHEIIHALGNTLAYSPEPGHPMLEEGLAHLFDATSQRAGPIDVQTVERGLQFVGGFSEFSDEPLRPAAQQFMYFLWTRYGSAAAIDLVLHSEYGVSLFEQNELFFRTTGSSLPELVEQYSQMAECSPFAARLLPVDCKEPHIAAFSLGWQESFEVDCRSYDAFGSDLGEVWVSRTFDVDAAGEFTLTTYGLDDNQGYVTMGRCDGGCDSNFRVSMWIGEQSIVELEPGRYVVSFRRRENIRGRVGLQIRSGVRR